MIKYDNLYNMYYHFNMDNTFIKGDNMELIELTEAIEDAKASYELAKTEKETLYYKAILQELKNEKQELMNKFNRSC